MRFEWDAWKDAANQAKHRVAFRQAADVFRHFRLVREDDRRDYGERRLIALGETDGLVLTVVFTWRGSRIRIISAWRASKHDREIYEVAREARAHR